ncbi:hypothetical protein IWW38_003146 [Coemansia aciculifera]|uniref:Uncharacterized protein n=1 Tax=Coemansia aciculifera TaxID=417176 RepID=A0ACC1M355_9FUNG|nr:hypothetical protein IWW38_003146 [Coemansia aciculifera]
MVCSICQESFFKATPKSARRTTHGSSSNSAAATAARNGHRPAALGCGHTFHKKCIDAWFVSSSAQLCPQCKVAHVGPVTILFIELDEEDIAASKGGEKSKKRERRARPSDNCPCGNSELRQLAMGMMSLNIEDKDIEYYTLCELARRNEELEDMNEELQDELNDAYYALEQGGGGGDDEELDELTEQLAEQCNLNRRTEASLEEKSQDLWAAQVQMASLRDRLASLETLSGRHRTHIGNLQRALAERKRELAEYQDTYGYI